MMINEFEHIFSELTINFSNVVLDFEIRLLDVIIIIFINILVMNTT